MSRCKWAALRVFSPQKRLHVMVVIVLHPDGLFRRRLTRLDIVYRFVIRQSTFSF
jgi:hypothetical protein